jgi:1,4-dihydroxy-2-naphthoyl-CoA hydrolase
MTAPAGGSTSTCFVLPTRTSSSMTPSDSALALYASMPHRGMADTLGIEVVELGAERVVATMPVDRRTQQPFGILHGGASVALAETVASLGAWMNVDRDRFHAVGLEINANHLRAKSDGIVRATATPIHRGGTTHVWNIEIRDEQERMVCVARCTMAVVPKR